MTIGGIIGTYTYKQQVGFNFRGDLTSATGLYDMLAVNGWNSAVIQLQSSSGDLVDFWDWMDNVTGTRELFEFSDPLNPRSVHTWMTATGTTTVLINTWYDQSGHGRDAVKDNDSTAPVYLPLLRVIDFNFGNVHRRFRIPPVSFPPEIPHTRSHSADITGTNKP